MWSSQLAQCKYTLSFIAYCHCPPTGDFLAKLKLWKHLEKFDKFLEISESGLKISCNFQENVKEQKGIYRKYATIVENLVEILRNFQCNS